MVGGMRRQGRYREGVSALRVRLGSGASEAMCWEEIVLANQCGVAIFVWFYFPHSI